MSTTKIAIVVAIGLLAAVSPALANERTDETSGDIVETAVAAGSFETLVKAVKAAGLVEALQGEGPFTVFAPTDEAFSKLPSGTVAALLEPGRRATLTRILTFHVVRGRVLAKDLLPVASAKTLSGDTVPLGLRVGDANVVQADILCSNGVIHVVDSVLLPPAKESEDGHANRRVSARIETAIERGVPIYNSGDPESCARIYRETARGLIHGVHAAELHRMLLTDAVTALHDDASAEAWALREVFDRMLTDIAFEPRVEAPMPEGFPGPGAVGRVVAKRYPGYRAARAEGRNAFWTLFEHIQTNDVPMTAPVEMTMDDDLREQDMAFLYERTTQGQTGAQGRVDVLDIEPIHVLSIGVRGDRTPANERMAKKAIEAEFERRGLKASGPWRALGYNSPMVPREQRFWELQVPVE